MQQEKIVNDIYMLTDTDPEILDKKDACEYLKKQIIKSCTKYQKVMGNELFNRYISKIYDLMINQKIKLEDRIEIYDAMKHGQMIGGLI